MASKTIVFVHGMFVTRRCWDGWVERFGAHGYTCHAPPWPGRDASVAELRARHPDAELAKLDLPAIVDAYADVVRGLPEAPVLVGHSMGGLIVQLLLQRGLGARGVAIDSAPPQGVSSASWSFVRSNWPMITPFASKHAPHLLTFEQFRYAFVHVLSPDEQRRAYDEHVVPESRLVARGPLSDAAKIDGSAAGPPLLLVAGGEDHIIPASLNRANFAKYGGQERVGLHEFPGRCHYLIAQDGWTEIADYVRAWIER